MNRYANELFSALSRLDQVSWGFSLVRPEQPRWLSRLWKHPQSVRLESAIARYALYPISVRRRTADLFHVLDHGYGHLVRGLDPDRTIVTCHDIIPLLGSDRRIPITVPASVVRTFKFRLREMTRATRILADSEATRDGLIEYTDIPAARIVVIGLGVSEAFTSIEPPEAEVIRRTLDFSVNDKVVLQVATRGRYKNTPTLLRALSQLRQRLGSSVVLARIGVPLYDDESALADRLGVKNAIRSVGAIADDRGLVDWYRAANVLAFPSLWEGFGWPPLEAMASGTPVVASNIPAVREVVTNAGALVDPEDDAALAGALERVLTDTEYAAQLRSRGLERAQEFSWERTARRTLAVYDEVAAASMTSRIH